MAPVKVSFLLLLILCCSGDPTTAGETYEDNPKPGYCAISNVRCFAKSPGECETDKDCHGDKKCCTKVCTPECTAPLFDKPGNCPEDDLYQNCLTKKFAPLCEHDYQCNDAQKCCYYGCRQQCKHPIFYET